MLALFPLKAFGANNSIVIPVEQVFSVTPGVARDGIFQYTLQRIDSEAPGNLAVDTPLPVGAQGDNFNFEIAGNQVVDLGPITFVRAGVYTYEIRSTHAPTSGFILDDTVYTVVIIVRNAPGGGLVPEIASISTGLNKIDNPTDTVIVFNKSYGSLASDPWDSGKGNYALVHSVLGNPAVPYTFTFRLEAQNAGQPMPAAVSGMNSRIVPVGNNLGGSEMIPASNLANAEQPMPEAVSGTMMDITIVGDGGGPLATLFGTWSYSTAGTFVYTVRQIPSDHPNYTFDTDTFYRITDTVTSENGQLVVERVVTNQENRQVGSLPFISIYRGSDREVQLPPVSTPTTPPAGTEVIPGAPGTTAAKPIPGPKTGDYEDPAVMIIAMVISASVALFALLLVYLDRKSEKEYGDVDTTNATVVD